MGYLEFWSLVFAAFDIDLDDNLRKQLANRDKIKSKKLAKDQSIEGNKLRGKRKYNKLDQAHKDWQEMQRTGVGYETGMAVVTKKECKTELTKGIRSKPKRHTNRVPSLLVLSSFLSKGWTQGRSLENMRYAWHNR